jgi:outer membrane protein
MRSFSVKTRIIFLSILLVAAAVCMVLWQFTKNKKIGWINLPEVYKEFKYTKELESKLMTTHNTRKHIIDSMEFEIRVLADGIKTEKTPDKRVLNYYNLKLQEYLQKKKEFEEDDYSNKAKYEEQILTQLNQYVKDYGTENGYQLLLGADGSGTLMYASQAIEITNAVKTYVNERYEGKN